MQPHAKEGDVAAKPAKPPRDELLSPSDVEREYGIPRTTQAGWRCTNRMGFRELVVKLGSTVKYKRSKLDAWIDSCQLVSGDHK
jgi:hypothetical protein